MQGFYSIAVLSSSSWNPLLYGDAILYDDISNETSAQPSGAMAWTLDCKGCRTPGADQRQRYKPVSTMSGTDRSNTRQAFFPPILA